MYNRSSMASWPQGSPRPSKPQCLEQTHLVVRLDIMETDRLLEAAQALSSALSAHSIPHAFHGSILIAMLSNNSQCDELLCIVEGNNVHPFGRVRQALNELQEFFDVINSPWSNRLHVRYRQLTPSVMIEILPAGEEGPRHLNGSTTTRIRNLPFLTVSEFLRAKIRAWTLRGNERDAGDIMWVLEHYWQNIDINRIPDQDMEQFVTQFPAAASAWNVIRGRYSSLRG